MTKLTCCEIREKNQNEKLPQNKDNYFFYKLLIDYVKRNNCKECKTWLDFKDRKQFNY
ncbi:MAG: hypothetical protein I3273_01340 [Candidatus Moeniiplasma glomeromycotorum]|nr:hypothetical protein [Candidatus Moeniiplasma glomeromycotorum]MCE8167234.1 hypothetical protein [Candidatus Moeniiplasma glomeromycotorum]MCE8168753.1 hypothetical protein [Candidatus Moeniiplasma glomeromycotorum]